MVIQLYMSSSNKIEDLDFRERAEFYQKKIDETMEYYNTSDKKCIKPTKDAYYTAIFWIPLIVYYFPFLEKNLETSVDGLGGMTFTLINTTKLLGVQFICTKDGLREIFLKEGYKYKLYSFENYESLSEDLNKFKL